ncbi:C-type lectin domain family 2 member L-like isoform X2 [Liolophura sinensis]|uniref:C-type lectin domain family 2 member L-like isoform X2 n=1 Tax=Liolophura sinensis TaxID=3198878 RepID=UPI003159582B
MWRILSLILLLLWILQGSLGVIREECEEGWKLFGFNCYRFFPDPTDFQSAKDSCENHNSTLSSVWSEAERKFIIRSVWKITRRDKSAWLGLVGDSDDTWKWLDGSHLDDPSKWPSINPEDCGAINGWNAVSKYNCYNQLLAAYVCKKPLIMMYGIGSLNNLTIPQSQPNMRTTKVILFERVPAPRNTEYTQRNKLLATIKVTTETDCAYHCFQRDDCKGFKLICLLNTKCQYFACILLSFGNTIRPYK